jgi:hypothetical protein
MLDLARDYTVSEIYLSNDQVVSVTHLGPTEMDRILINADLIDHNWAQSTWGYIWRNPHTRPVNLDWNRWTDTLPTTHESFCLNDLYIPNWGALGSIPFDGMLQLFGDDFLGLDWAF